MRYRKLDEAGDILFGHGPSDWLVDSEEAVAQAVLTRLRLFLGEYFADTREGTDWSGQVLGQFNRDGADIELRARIAGTQGVLSISSFSSTFDGETRRYVIQAGINSAFGPAAVTFYVP